jgi:hypothetical protein
LKVRFLHGPLESPANAGFLQRVPEERRQVSIQDHLTHSESVKDGTAERLLSRFAVALVRRGGAHAW